ncbi:endonuclease VIII-like 3 [Senna tora]|uniref:Endonuclease VIII-like 3 n=1 Tax=Senna tora TaxID=362788 RepID=A0A834TE55_9FABA|nr:endonuclease VIII-like 3 [Senna tora]
MAMTIVSDSGPSIPSHPEHRPQECGPQPLAGTSASKRKRRMLTDTCFRCRQQGHWARHCPLNSPTTKSHTPVVEDSGIAKIQCRCGYGFCEIRTATTNPLNIGRNYYVCPIKRGKKCSNFVKWCDAPINESDLRPPPYKYPECRCGAGVCRKERENTFPNAGYFTCPVPKDHGSCGFHLWENMLLDTTSVVPVQKSSQGSVHFNWVDNQVDETNGRVLNIGSENFKRMRIVNDSQCSPISAVSEVPEEASAEREDHNGAVALSTLKDSHFPEFEFADDLVDLDMTNTMSWDSIVEEARLLSTLRRFPSQQREVERKILTIGDAPFGSISCLSPACFSKFLRSHFRISIDPVAGSLPMGWLGRLVFFTPSQGLKLSPPQPLFCCIFPSFNAIVVPKQESIRDASYSESKQLVISNSSQPVEHSTLCHTETFTDIVSPNKSPGSKKRPMSKAERQRQMALFAQQQLLDDLESLDPLDHESMREAAEATFDVLDSLSVNYQQFSEHVWEFINCASSLAEIQNSMENEFSPQEHIQRYEEEEVRLAAIRDNYFKTKVSLEESHQLSESLREEASRLKAMLLLIENQLATCESETSMIETNLGEIKRNMREAETSFKVAAEKAEMARKLNEAREENQRAAITAMENARLELEK